MVNGDQDEPRTLDTSLHVREILGTRRDRLRKGPGKFKTECGEGGEWWADSGFPGKEWGMRRGRQRSVNQAQLGSAAVETREGGGRRGSSIPGARAGPGRPRMLRGNVGRKGRDPGRTPSPAPCF